MSARFTPDPETVYRVFFAEVEEGLPRTKQVVGFVTLYDDDSVLVQPKNKGPATYLRSYLKMVVWVPENGGP